MAAGVTTLCGVQDGKGLGCERDRGHDGLHQRWAVPGEMPYLEGPGNSIVSWPDGPAPVRRRIP